MFRFIPIFLFSLALLHPVFADEHDDGEFLDFGDAGGLVVTASRTAENAAEVPAQIRVINAEDIAGAANLTEVLERIPGVRFSGAVAGAGSESISMRGFGENSSGRVLVLVDGNRMNNPDMRGINWNSIPISGIERIEVMDGSASVQYGNSAVGGVINIITKKSGEGRTLIGVSGGSYFSNRASISHFAPVSWGSFSLSAENAATDGYRERQYSRTSGITGGANVFLGSNLQLSFNASFSDLYYQLPGALTRDHFEKNPRKALQADYSNFPNVDYVPNFDDENMERHFSGGAGITWFPAENAEFNLPLSYKGRIVRSDMTSFANHTNRALHAAEARPQFSVSFSSASLRVLGGVDLNYANLDAESFSDKSRDSNNRTNDFNISQWNIGPYLTAKFSPFDSLSFSAGARFDTSIVEADHKPVTAGAADGSGSKKLTAFVYEGGIVFNPVREMKFYARYATLFRNPFVDELAQVSGFGDKFNSELGPESGFNAEAGGSYNLGEKLEAFANFFYMEMKDEIAFDSVASANKNFEDRTRRIGANAGLSFSPVDFLSAEASYSFVDAVFIAGDNKDKSVPLVPAHKIYGSLTVKLPFGLNFGPEIEYTGASWYGQDFANEGDKLPSRFLLGAKARYTFKNEGRELSLTADVKNLLDKSYASMGFYSPPSSFSPSASYSVYPDDGRRINVSLHYRF